MKALVIGQRIVSRTEAVEEYLLNRGHSVSVIGLQSAFTSKKKKPLVLVFSGYILKTIFLVLWFRKRFDLCIGISHFSGMLAVVLRKIGVCKKAIYYCIDHYKGPGLMIKIENAVDRWTALHADEVWDISDRITKARGLNPWRYCIDLATVPLGYDPTYFRNNKDIDRYSLVFVGVMQKGHGLEMTLDILPSLVKDFPKIKVKVIGRGPFLDEFIDMVKKRNLSKYYRFYGFIPDTHKMLDIVANSAIGLAVWSEVGNCCYGDSGKTKLYSTCGIPVIVSDFVIYAEAITKYRAGIAIKSNDRDALASAIKEILVDDSRYYEFKKNAVLVGQEQCNSHKIFSKWI